MVTLAHLVILTSSLANKYNENVKVYDMIIYLVKIFKIFNVFYAFGFSLLKLLT